MSEPVVHPRQASTKASLIDPRRTSREEHKGRAYPTGAERASIDVEVPVNIAADILIGILLLFSLRRLLWVMASWLRRRTSTQMGRWPEVLITVAFRNEQDTLPRLLSSLDALNYDAGCFSICLVDDASMDAGTDLAAAWAHERTNVQLIVLDENVGKAEALNRGLASANGDPR